MTQSTKRSPDLIMSIRGNVLQTMFAYANEATRQFNSEIAGWAHYSHAKGIYKLAPLLRQEATMAEVDTFPDAILNDVNYKLDDLIVQWHSHSTMSVMWSGTDEANIRDMLKLIKTVISVVVNVYGKYRARMDTVVAGHGQFQFDMGEQTTYEIALQPYISSDVITKDVKDKLYKPKPPKKKNIVVRSIGFNNKGNGSSTSGGSESEVLDNIQDEIDNLDVNDQISMMQMFSYQDLNLPTYSDSTKILRQAVLSHVLLETDDAKKCQVLALHIHPNEINQAYVSLMINKNQYEYMDGAIVKNSIKECSMVELLVEFGYSSTEAASLIAKMAEKIRISQTSAP